MPPRIELLVGASAFWEKAREDITGAARSVRIQAMTFEGDESGIAVAEALRESSAATRRVLVDTYSRIFVSDRWVYSPLARRDAAFRDEVARTREMFLELEQNGVAVRFTNPPGPLFIHWPQRNHKKLLVIDDRVAYVGGINFSDHNFAWHDLMVRIEDPEVAAHLGCDFDKTWEGRPTAGKAEFEGVTIYRFDGLRNHEEFADVLGLIETAERSIEVISAYLTFPFCDALAESVKRGVRVTVLTPDHNNKRIIRDYLLWTGRRMGFDVRLTVGMSHLKAMLIDDRALLVGSSNFDFVSYHTQDELVAVLTGHDVIEAFRNEVLEPDLSRARPLASGDAPALRGALSFVALKAAETMTRASRQIVTDEYRSQLESPITAYGLPLPIPVAIRR